MNIESVFLTLLNMSISASWLALAILLLRLVFKKAPKVLFCLLWALVGIRLAFPFSIESVLSLIPSADTVPPEIIYSTKPEINTGIPIINNAVNPIISDVLAPSVQTQTPPAFTLAQIASAVWIIGFAAMIVYGAVSYILLRRKVSASIELKKRVLICDDIKSPFILGFIVPRIYIPSEIHGRKLEYILTHESSHIKRGDHIWKPIGFALLAVHWFNPIMWLAYILLCKDIEIACDEKVISGMSDEYKKEYSETLLSCSVHRKFVTACPLAFGEVGVKERIKSVMSYKKPTFWIALVSVAALIVTAVCFMTDPKKDSNEGTSIPLGSTNATLSTGETTLSPSTENSPQTGETTTAPDDANLFKQTIGGFSQYTDGSWCAPMVSWEDEVFFTEVGNTATFVCKDGKKFVFTRDGDLYRFVPEESDPLSSVVTSYNEKVVFERYENNFYDFYPIVEIMRGDLDGDGKEEALYVGPDWASGPLSFSLHLYEGNKFEGNAKFSHTSPIHISQDMKLTVNEITYYICFVDGVPMLKYNGKLYEGFLTVDPE